MSILGGLRWKYSTIPSYTSYNITQSFIGKPFFYYDEETGLGWESTIDQIISHEAHAGLTIALSCGTTLDINHHDLYTKGNKCLRTNLPE
jgi:hypothetical protein